MCGIVVSLACVPFAVLLDIALGSALSMVSANVVAELFTSPAIVVKLGVASAWVSPEGAPPAGIESADDSLSREASDMKPSRQMDVVADDGVRYCMVWYGRRCG